MMLPLGPYRGDDKSCARVPMLQPPGDDLDSQSTGSNQSAEVPIPDGLRYGRLCARSVDHAHTAMTISEVASQNSVPAGTSTQRYHEATDEPSIL